MSNKPVWDEARKELVARIRYNLLNDGEGARSTAELFVDVLQEFVTGLIDARPVRRAADKLADDLTEAVAMAAIKKIPDDEQISRWANRIAKYGDAAGWERTSA